MNPSVKQAWLQALRSGEYTQCRDTMRRDETYCATGVLCALHAKASGSTWTKNHQLWAYHGFYGTPSITVQRWAGLDTGAVASVSYRNDEGKSFAQIADYIEATL